MAIEIACAIIALLLSRFYHISTIEWIAVITVIGLVFVTELLNTSLEEFCDMVKSDPDPHIKKIKDLASAAVLTSTIFAFVVGCIIFLPKIFIFQN